MVIRGPVAISNEVAIVEPARKSTSGEIASAPVIRSLQPPPGMSLESSARTRSSGSWSSRARVIVPAQASSVLTAVRMYRLTTATITVTAILSALVLAAGPKFTSTWKAPGAADETFANKKVAALVITDDEGLRVSGEEALVRELAAIGLTQGVATYRIVPRPELRDVDKARGWYERAKVEGVVAMRLVKADSREVPGPSAWSMAASPYGTLWGYYPYAWSSVYVFEPGGSRRETVAAIETLVFSVPRNTLLWAGVTESINPKDSNRVIKDVVAATVKEMTKQGLIRR